MLRNYFCILLAFTINIEGISQSFEEKDFKHYTTSEGLSAHYITGLAQDSYGNIWISTLRGLNRFDGITFKQFLHSGKYPIPDNSIFSMKMLPHNQLAIATDDGAQIINTLTLQTKNLNIPTTDALRYWSNACRHVSVDKEGNYAVSTKTGFFIFSPSGKLKKRFDRYTLKDIGLAWMMFGSHIHQLPDGNIMQENHSGLLMYDRKSNEIIDATNHNAGIKKLFSRVKKNRDIFFFISAIDVVVLNSSTNSFDIINITDGSTRSFAAPVNLVNEIGWQTRPTRINDSLWAINSKNKGFFLLHIDTFASNIKCLPKRYFPDQFCTFIFSDREKRLWIGTNEGVFMQTNHLPVIQSFSVKTSDNTSFNITSLYVLNDKIFAGTDNKEIIVIDKKRKNVIRRIAFSSFNNAPINIMSFLLVHPDTLWVGSTSGLRWLHTKNFTAGTIVAPNVFDETLKPLILFRDTKKNIWIASNRINEIIFYNSINKTFKILNSQNDPLLKVNTPNSFAEDSKGRIWIGGDAIARYNPRLQKIDTLIEHLPTQKNRKKGYMVMNDSNEDIWATVSVDGFAKLTGNKIYVSSENIIYDQSLSVAPTLLQDRIFMATPGGAGFLNTKTLRRIVFNKADGLPGQKITSYHFSYDSLEKSVWFAGDNEIGKLPLIANWYKNSPVLRFSEVQVVNDTLIHYPSASISLGHNQNDVNISFSAVNYYDPENMRFAYRIKNRKDSTWIETGTQQNILLTNISPGNYLLEAKVYSFDNKWQPQTKELEVIINPPFWKTFWFYAAVALLIAATVYYLYNRRIKQIEQKANLDKLLAQTEMKALHSQMNPHFIFNCLNSIREMILNNENNQASHYLSKFAQLIRMTLHHSSKPFISLQNTIEYLQRYLEMEQIRNNRFTYQIHVDDKLLAEDIFLHPMLIQPFIENAIWHNALPQDQRMHLSIQFISDNNQLICIIEDNGIGIQTSLKNKELQTTHHSVGIDNIRQRIQVLNEKYNLNSSLTIEDKYDVAPHNGTGTIVTLHLPLKTSEQ